MKQQCRQHAHHQHDGQSLQREHEFGAGHLEVVGELAAAEITEDEGGAGSAGGGNRPDRIVDPGEDAGDARYLEQDEGGREREQKAGRGRFPCDGAAVLADDPGEGEEGADT